MALTVRAVVSTLRSEASRKEAWAAPWDRRDLARAPQGRPKLASRVVPGWSKEGIRGRAACRAEPALEDP